MRNPSSSDLTNRAIMRITRGNMDIDQRNQDIVARGVARETFASIGERYKISRERVRQIFDKHASKADKKSVTGVSQNGMAKVMSRREAKARLHLLTSKQVEISHDAIRIGIADWVSGKLKIEKQPAADSESFAHRLDILLPVTLESKFRAKCDKVGFSSASAAIRAIITALESK